METPAYPVRISSRANATKAADATAAVAVHLSRCCDGGLAAHLLSALAAAEQRKGPCTYLITRTISAAMDLLGAGWCSDRLRAEEPVR